MDRKGCHLTLDNVLAWVCTQCGEAYFKEKEANMVQNLIVGIDQHFHDGMMCEP
ncbi:MAG: YgiT-type zinc finger protein [Deltaproteobacteria bacterium]|nr:YgiT-type zinc finger protein [Deltaproteobacteria bacterium]